MNNNTLCSHDCKIHALLVSRITVLTLYLCLQIQLSLFTPRCWLILLYLSNCELNMSLLYCVVQSSFRGHDPAPFLLLTLELKGLSMIHVHNYERKRFSSVTSLGKPTCSPALPNQWVLRAFFCYSIR